MPIFEEYCEEIKDLWETRWLTNAGKKHQLLELLLKDRLETSNVVLYTNGHLALEGIWEILNFPPGSEVITSPFTFCSTVHAIVRKGLVPIFCDIDQHTYCIDPAKIEQLITKKTVAICPIHVYGNMCDVEKIEILAKKYNLKVVYDAAHAFGVKYKGKSSGSFGDFTMFSFHATKVFNTIEGGCVCLNDENTAVLLSEMKNFGICNQESVPFVGGNAKMNEFQAAMGICNLRHLDEEIRKRGGVVKKYRERLGNVDGIFLCSEQKGVIPNYAYFPVVFNGFKKTRDEVYDELKENGIVARKYFYPLVNDMECYSKVEKNDSNKTPIAKRISNTVLTLPLYADLSLQDVDRICDIILN